MVHSVNWDFHIVPPPVAAATLFLHHLCPGNSSPHGPLSPASETESVTGMVILSSEDEDQGSSHAVIEMEENPIASANPTSNNDESLQSSLPTVYTKVHVGPVSRKCSVVCSAWPQTTTTMTCYRVSCAYNYVCATPQRNEYCYEN